LFACENSNLIALVDYIVCGPGWRRPIYFLCPPWFFNCLN